MAKNKFTTYQIDYYDKELAQRFYWTEAKSEKEALQRFYKECNVNQLKEITVSPYTIDELLMYG